MSDAAPPTPSPTSPVLAPGAGHGRYLAAVVLVIGALFALVHNGYWTPGNDSEVYVATARSLAAGEGYTFNGEPTAIAPPGWPVVLAGLMKLSPTFGFLKAANAAMMLASLAVFYLVCRRFASPRLAGVAVVCAALLHPVYQLTFMLHSEGLFNLCTAGAVLLGLKTAEADAAGRRGPAWGWAAGASALLAYAVFTRYAGLFVWPLVAGAMAGVAWRGRPTLAGLRNALASPRLWGMLLSLAAAVGTFKATMAALALTDDEAKAAEVAGGGGADYDEPPVAEVPPPPELAETPAPDAAPTTDLRAIPGQGDWLLGHAGRSIWAEYALRVGRSGKWFSWLLWHPAQFGDSFAPVEVLGIVTGFTTMLLLAAGALRQVWRGHLMWLGLLGYCGAIALVWPNVNNRYLVPLAPLVVLGPLLALVPHFGRGRAGLVAKATAGLFVGAIVVVNLAMYAVDLRVARAGDYYASYEAGAHDGLVDLAKHVRGSLAEGPVTITPEPPPPVTLPVTFATIWPEAGEDVTLDGVGVSTWYYNLGRSKRSKAGLRSAVVLTGARSVPTPKSPTFKNPAPETYRVARWCRANGLRYFLYKREATPWRVWHFRLTPGLHESIAGTPPAPDSGDGEWELWEVVEGEAYLRRVEVEPTDGWPTRVPGL